MGLGIAFVFWLKCCNPVISCYSYEVSNKRKLFVGSLSSSSLAPVSFQSIYDLLRLMRNVSNRVIFSSSSVLCFTKCEKREGSCRLHEEQVRWRKRLGGNLLHLFANWNIFGSGHALLLQSFLFQNAMSHMFYSNFPSFTPSINI